MIISGGGKAHHQINYNNSGASSALKRYAYQR
jgi:hypothetical protein